ncbi:glucokinase [Teichococcus wenyumeiae]|uniref:glucokinase n=1 Tax=Teichococcus wenyumeiae TaxID=2478470 RepID=UPI001F478634|nr:glucokinase [Pseudoroseomonas wenyumeiae]
MRLVGDIGGTNARFALCGPDGTPKDERKLPVREYSGLVEAAQAYLAGREVEEAVFAVAAPVVGGAADFTNSSWRFTVPEARERLGLRSLTVINDFVAQAWAVHGMASADFHPLKPGVAKPGRPRVVIGPGTGLGVAFLLRDGERPMVLASEAGHSSFSPQDERQAEILAKLRREFGHVSTERLLSGPGLMRMANGLAELEERKERFGAPPEVSQGAAEGCALCLEAVRMFSAILGATAGDLVLTLLADGGVHVTGGLCRNLGPLLDVEAMVQGFTAKGRLAGYLETVPVDQVTRPHSGLLGAALHRAA